MPRHRQLPPAYPGSDLTGGTPEDILLVLDSIVAEGQGLAAGEVRALRDALAEALDATVPDEPFDGNDLMFGAPDPFTAPASPGNVYLDVDGLAQVWNGLGHLMGVGEA